MIIRSPYSSRTKTGPFKKPNIDTRLRACLYNKRYIRYLILLYNKVAFGTSSLIPSALAFLVPNPNDPVLREVAG